MDVKEFKAYFNGWMDAIYVDEDDRLHAPIKALQEVVNSLSFYDKDGTFYGQNKIMNSDFEIWKQMEKDIHKNNKIISDSLIKNVNYESLTASNKDDPKTLEEIKEIIEKSKKQ